MFDEGAPETSIIHTEKVKSERKFSDSEKRPFVEPSKTSVDVAVGDPNAVFVKMRRNFFDFVKTARDKLVGEQHPKFKRISKFHGRNMTEASSSAKVLWSGNESGDIYGAWGVKGGSMDTPEGMKVEQDSEHYYGIHGWGLMDDSCVPRINMASLYMRRNGLPTERVRQVDVIKEVWINRKDKKEKTVMYKVPIHEWEESEVNRLQKEVDEDVEKGLQPWAEDKAMVLEKVKKYLKETEFITIKRDLQVDERIRDIADAAKNDKLKVALSPVLKWVNIAIEKRSFGMLSNSAKSERFDPGNDDDIYRYLIRWLPSQMGAYLGKFHGIGLTHRFLHDQNWSAVGTIYDLDSVSGKGVFTSDEEPSQQDIDRDVFDTMDGITALVTRDLPKTREFNNRPAENMVIEATTLYLQNYLTQRFDKDGALAEIDRLKRVYGASFILPGVWDNLQREFAPKSSAGK